MSKKKKKSKGTLHPAPPPKEPAPEGFRSERELILRVVPGVELRARGGTVETAAGKKMPRLTKLLDKNGATMEPLFGPTEESVRRRVERAGPDAPRLERFYRVRAEDKHLDKLAEKLRAQPEFDAAYVKPPTELASPLVLVEPQVGDPPPVTPDFTSSQGYLNAAPEGVHARYAWKRAGGQGAGVQIIDVEGAWRFTHETLLENQGGLLAGVQTTNITWRNHGTAVMGVFGGDGLGVTGIARDANTSAVSFTGTGSAQAVTTAADQLAPGGILLFELHRPGPRFGHLGRPDQRGYIPPEWWPDDFAALQYATMCGVIVVEVGGNGNEDLDDPVYDVPATGFPEDWINPFRRIKDSGVILVGAGAPPPGTHGNNHGPDRSRLGFSNYGSILDVQAWGREITTCGYGDLQGGGDEDRWYTERFAGTSGASSIVTGVLACIQGALDAAGYPLLTPATARHLLRTTGSPQEDAPARPKTERIGNRPNLRQAFQRLRLGRVRPAPPVDRRGDPIRVDDAET